MKFFKYLVLLFILSSPMNIFAGGPPGLEVTSYNVPAADTFAYYDLRNRNTFIQVTNQDIFNINGNNSICIHVQIFQQDQGCTELDFEDELTPNDTVIYDMDNIIRNNGSSVPVNLDDDSYGFVAISAYECGNTSDSSIDNALIGSFRIVDDSGYEYRSNLLSGARGAGTTNDLDLVDADTRNSSANVIIPFNTIDDATYSDIVAFVVNVNNDITCNPDNELSNTVCNDPVGATFSVFLIDEDEERLSCDQKNFACGANKVMNYGINEDYPNSRGGPLLCDGAGLLPGQTHGYISLEDAVYDTSIPGQRESEFFCVYGLNNNNGTGSMEPCQFTCVDEGFDPGDCDED